MRTTTIAAVTLAAALALTGCSGTTTPETVTVTTTPAPVTVTETVTAAPETITKTVTETVTETVTAEAAPASDGDLDDVQLSKELQRFTLELSWGDQDAEGQEAICWGVETFGADYIAKDFDHLDHDVVVEFFEDVCLNG